MIIIGIDPGLTGGIAFMNRRGLLLDVSDMPVMAKGKGTSRVKMQINPAGIREIVEIYEPEPMVAYLERVSAMPDQGVASVFSMGDTFGAIRATFATLGIPVEIITPQLWKKYYKLGKDKEVVRAKAIELYPEAPLSRKKDHNRAEAILIARYGCNQP